MIFSIHLHELPSYDARSKSGEFDILSVTPTRKGYTLVVRETPGVKLVNQNLAHGTSSPSLPPALPAVAPVAVERDLYKCPVCGHGFDFDAGDCPACAESERERLDILDRIKVKAQQRRADYHSFKKGERPMP